MVGLIRESKSPASQVEEHAVEPVEHEIVPSKVDPDWLIPTSSTLLNCACSDYHTGGFGIGKLVNLIGDSSSGKSMVALSVFAEMCMWQRYDDYRLIYDDVEAALEFNLDYLFGARMSRRVELDTVSDTVQDFYGNIVKALKDGRPFVYILDSLDALTSVEELDRAMITAGLKKPKKGDPGSWKTEKPKLIGEILRVTAREIKEHEAVVIIISQTRDNLGFGFTSKTRSGGRALKFYCTHEMWLSVKEPILKKKIPIGAHTNFKISKNKLTGKKRNVDMMIYEDLGVDNLTVNMQYLIDSGIWTMEKQTIIAPELKLQETMAKMIEQVEEKNLEPIIEELVGDTWRNFEEELRLGRKRRYA